MTAGRGIDVRDICHTCGFQRGSHDGYGGGPCDLFEDCRHRMARLVGPLSESEFIDEKGEVWKMLLADDFSPLKWTHIPRGNWHDRQEWLAALRGNDAARR